MIAYIFTLAKRFPSWTSLTRYFQSRKPVVLVLHLLVKIDYITALVQLLGRELHDLSNRNVNKPPVTEENSYRKITCPMGTATLPSKNIYIYSTGWIESRISPRPKNGGSKYSRKPWLEKRTRMKEWRTTCSPFPLCLFLARDTKLVTRR